MAEKQSFSGAAEALHLSQPTISQNVKALEQEYGVPLFFRNPHRVSLTEAGRALYPLACQITDLYLQSAQRMRDFSHSEKAALAVGTTSCLAEWAAPALLRCFRSLHPQVQVLLEVGSPRALVEELKAAGVDVLLVPAVPGPGGGASGAARPQVRPQLGWAPGCTLPASWSSLNLWEARWQAVVAPGHPWAGRRAVSLQELVRQAPLIPMDDALLCRRWREILQENRLPAAADPGFQVSGSAAAVKAWLRLQAEKTGPGAVAVLPAWAVAGEQRSGALAGLAIQDADLSVACLLIWDTQRLPPGAHLFVQYCSGPEIRRAPWRQLAGAEAVAAG